MRVDRDCDVDVYAVCVECGQPKRLVDFSPRHGHCNRHKRARQDCRACEDLRNSTFRQPRCKDCDRARGSRRRCFKRLCAETARHGCSPRDVLRPESSSCSSVAVRGVSDLPRSLVDRLDAIAGTLVRLELHLRCETAARSLFAALPPDVLTEAPRGARTFAPIYDLAAAAGGWSEGQLPSRRGFIDTCGRTSAEDFVVAIKGRSMVPTLPDGSLAVFRREDAGPYLNRRIVLAALHEAGDPDYGGRFTVKRLHWLAGDRTGIRIKLLPDNPEFPAIPVGHADVRILGVFRRSIASA